MSLPQSLRNAAFGLGLTFFPSCGSGSNDCEDDFDCLEPEVCRQDECVNPNEGEVEAETGYVEHLRETTDSGGEVTFAREGREIPVQVKDRESNPLPGINVHYAFKEDKNVILAIDPDGRFVPDRHIFSGSAPTANVRRKENAGRNERRAGLLNLINFVLDNTDMVGTIIEEATAPHHGDLLEEGEDVNKYCMKREDVLKKTISTPAGLILLAPEAAGMDTTLLRSAIDTPLRNIAEWYIVSRYGQQLGYEVWVPKRATNLCGRNYDALICDLSGGQLESLWASDLPYWRINGACVPGEGGEREEPKGNGCIQYIEEEFENGLDEKIWNCYDECSVSDGIMVAQDGEDDSGATLSLDNLCCTNQVTVSVTWRHEDEEDGIRIFLTDLSSALHTLLIVSSYAYAPPVLLSSVNCNGGDPSEREVRLSQEDIGYWNRMRFEIDGRTLKVYHNGGEVLTRNDLCQYNVLPSGIIVNGWGALDSELAIDYVGITCRVDD